MKYKHLSYSDRQEMEKVKGVDMLAKVRSLI